MSDLLQCQLDDELEEEKEEEEGLMRGVLCNFPGIWKYIGIKSLTLGLALAGELEMHQVRVEAQNPARLYPTRADLPAPTGDTAWQHLLAAQQDRAFITTMGFDIDTFNYILDSGFQRIWDMTLIARRDVNENSVPWTECRLLDAAGGLGLMLHYLHSCMVETSLQQIFGLIPATVDRYLNFAMDILDKILQDM